jgi:ribosomal protein S1
MKTSLLNSALVAVSVLALCAPVALHAQTNTTNPIATAPVKNPPMATTATSSSKKMAKTPYKGTVKSIDATSLVVTTTKGDETLAIDPKTKFTADKKKAAATDITVGEKVTGSFCKNDDGTMTAASVHGHTK